MQLKRKISKNTNPLILFLAFLGSSPDLIKNNESHFTWNKNKKRCRDTVGARSPTPDQTPLVENGDGEPLVENGDSEPLVVNGDGEPLVENGDGKPLVVNGDSRRMEMVNPWWRMETVTPWKPWTYAGQLAVSNHQSSITPFREVRQQVEGEAYQTYSGGCSPLLHPEMPSCDNVEAEWPKWPTSTLRVFLLSNQKAQVQASKFYSKSAHAREHLTIIRSFRLFLYICRNQRDQLV